MKRFFVKLANMLAIAAFAAGFVACGEEEEPNVVEATVITVAPTTVTLGINDEQTLIATVLPEAAVDKTVVWSSSAATIAEVNASTGKVTAKAAGTATITATTVNGKTAVCDVTVSETVIAVESLSIDSATLNLKVGQRHRLAVVFTPENPTNQTVAWSSDNSKVVLVNPSSGEVTALTLGTATITATTANRKTSSCVVTVSPTEVTTVTVNPRTTELKEGEKELLTVVVEPSDATDKTITWSSSAPDTVSVNPLTGEITANAAGATAIIYATALNGVKDSCVVTVPGVVVTLVTISDTAVSLIEGGKYTLTADAWPFHAVDRDITWSSSAPEIVSVNETGEITALTLGTATIYATSVNGTKAECVVTVIDVVFRGPHILSAAEPLELSACDFDLGGEGVAFHETSGGGDGGAYRKSYGDVNSNAVGVESNGANIGYTGAGEWLTYTVEVQDADVYALDISLSATNNGRIGISLDDEDAGEWAVPNNGSWSNYRYLFASNPNLGPAPSAYLTAGKHKVKISIIVANYNLKSLKFTYVED